MNRKTLLKAKDIERLENTSPVLAIHVQACGMTCECNWCTGCGSDVTWCQGCSDECTNATCGCTGGITACACTDNDCTLITCACGVSAVCCDTIRLEGAPTA